jgi:hypothetical protein
VKTVIISIVTFLWAIIVYRRNKRISVSHIPGPGSESFVLGEYSACRGANFVLIDLRQFTRNISKSSWCPRFQVSANLWRCRAHQRTVWSMANYLTWRETFIIRYIQEDRLLISDPKALQYIFHTSGTYESLSITILMCMHFTGYGFLKWPERTEISRILMGRGLLWADGIHTPFP